MKNILIALSGLSPQVITETVFALYKFNKILVDEIIILTTSEGKNRIYKNTVINSKTGIKTKYNLKDELKRLSKICKFTIPAVNHNKITVHCADDEDIELTDVSTILQAKAFPELIIRVLKKYTQNDNNVIHCSLSGGRKTMSFYMGMALSFLGRENDKLWHIVASKEFESSGKYFPEKKSEVSALTLSEISYVNLRPVLKQLLMKKEVAEFSFNDLVFQTQKLLKKHSSPKLIINCSTMYIRFSDNVPVKLSDTEFAIYYLICINKKEGCNTTISNISYTLCKDKDKIELYKKRVLTYINKLNKKIEKAVNDFDYAGKYVILGPRELRDGAGVYGITGEFEDLVLI